MHSRKRSRKGARSTGRGEMPAGEMAGPTREGLTEMPFGEDTGVRYRDAGLVSGHAAGMQSGLMPGESPIAAGRAQDGEMPGSGMSSSM